MRNIARLIEMNGGLEALPARPIALTLAPLTHKKRIEWIYIDDAGPGPYRPNTRLVSVSYLLEDRLGILEPRVELFFEVGTGASRRFGWRRGTWRPIWIEYADRDRCIDFVITAAGKISPRLWGEWRADLRRWDDQIAKLDLFAALDRDLAFERDLHSRLREEHADRARADLEVARHRERERDTLGRFARTA